MESLIKVGLNLKEDFKLFINEIKDLGEVGAVSFHISIVEWLEKIAARGIKKANPAKLVNALSRYVGKTYQFGKHTIRLTKGGLKYTERHHPEFWNGTIKNGQSFLSKTTAIEQIELRIEQVISNNREKILSDGSNKLALVETIKGVEYQLTIIQGKIVQFFSK